jgi:TonB family protein
LKIGSWKLEIGSSSLFQGWIKANPFTTFVIISLLIHFIFIGFIQYRHKISGIDGSEKIEFDYYESREVVEKEEIELPEPALMEDQAELPEPEYPEEEFVPPPDELTQVESAIAGIILPPVPADVIDPGLAMARALGKYISYLQDIIDLQLEYPERASREGREGEVTVLFTLDNTGQLLALSIPAAGKSDFHPFNRAAMNAVRQSARYFAAFPEVITEETITFRLPIEFSLK